VLQLALDAGPVSGKHMGLLPQHAQLQLEHVQVSD
jgi:hypothetical protein